MTYETPESSELDLERIERDILGSPLYKDISS